MSEAHLRRLVDETRYSENIQSSMRVPSCISLQGDKNEERESFEKEKIILQTPPDTLKLDDSNYWVDNRFEDGITYEDYADGETGVAAKPTDPEPATIDSMIDTVQYNNQTKTAVFDDMSEVEKLRNQMFKVNRRITKLERTNLDLDQSSRYALYISVAAVTFSLCTFIFRP